MGRTSESIDEEFVEQSAALTGDRMTAVASAFASLVARSWPRPEIEKLLRAAERATTPTAICRALLTALEAAYAEFPTAMFWWKNETSLFLGFCPRFAKTSGVSALQLLGRTDADAAVTWNRQAVLYMKDDREVLESRIPRLDILERQDRGDATVWLRTSKVPYFSTSGDGTVGGFDTISAAHAQQLARARRTL